MPKIPTYISEGGISGVAQPQMGAFPDVYKPINTLVQTGVEAVTTFMKAKEKAREADEKLDLETQMNNLKLDFGQREIQLKQQGMNPDQYPGAVQGALTQSLDAAERSLKYPESRQRFRALAAPFLTKSILDSQMDAEKIRHAQMETAAGVLQQQDANTAVSGETAEERQAAFQRSLTRIDGLVRVGVYSGAKAEAETKALLANVERGQFLRDFRDPLQRPRVLADLAAGKGQHLAPDAQLTLLRELQTQQDTEAEKRRVAEERANQAAADSAEKNIVDAMAKNDQPTALAELGKARDVIKSGEEYRKWLDYIKSPKQEHSDPAILKHLDIAVYGLNGNNAKAIAEARSQVIAAAGAGALNSTDLARLLGHTQSMQTALRNRSEDQALAQLGHRHSAVVDQIKEDLKVAGPMERLVPQAQQVQSMALEEIRRRSAYTGGQEDPSEVYRQRRNIWMAHIQGAANARLIEIKRMLRYPDVQTLTQNRGAFRNEEDYYAQVRLMKDAADIQAEIERVKNAGATGTSSSSTPQPSGGKSLGY